VFEIRAGHGDRMISTFSFLWLAGSSSHASSCFHVGARRGGRWAGREAAGSRQPAALGLGFRGSRPPWPADLEGGRCGGGGLMVAAARPAAEARWRGSAVGRVGSDRRWAGDRRRGRRGTPS
jgi:hypothetical protein